MSFQTEFVQQVKSKPKLVLNCCKAKLWQGEKCKCPEKKMSGSLIAKNGFKAEKIFRQDQNIKESLEKYFKKTIKKIIPAPHGKKSDHIIVFIDDTFIKIQQKKLERLGGRGDSFDRRHIQNTFDSRWIRKYLTLLTLIRPTPKSTAMTSEQKKDFVSLCNRNRSDIEKYIQKTLIGANDEYPNEYWCFMKTNRNLNTASMELHIIKSSELYKFMVNSIDPHISYRKNGTCLHLNKHISLQRKGGGKSDNRPNEIQAKLKITQNLLDKCIKILN